LLNSDTEVTSGAIAEMQSVLHLHYRNAAVCPRSNAATLCTVPLGHEPSPEESFRVWARIRDLLPRYSVVPTAVGFCMLVRSTIIERFGAFDEAYSPGYNEENDFICRINRFGYSAVLAHRAFVFHYAGASFGSRRKQLEMRNARLLASRYPEYDRAVSDYFSYLADPIDLLAPAFKHGRPKILYDLSHLEPHHSGTSQFGLTLLSHLAPLLEPDCDLYIDVNRAALNFFGNQLVGYRLYDQAHDMQTVFDLAYKPCQIFSWAAFNRMNRRAVRVCFTLQDIIGLRCTYLSAASRHEIFRNTVNLADEVFTISDAARGDFEAYFGVCTSMRVIRHGAETTMTKSGGLGEYVLLVGGRFDHKAVVPAIEALRGTRMKVLGGEPPKGFTENADVEWVTGGELTPGQIDRLYRGARTVVYPSQYEGFGLPIIEACQRGKPIIVFDDPVMREVSGLLDGCDIKFIRRFDQLRVAIEASTPFPPADGIRTWDDAAREYAEAFRGLLARGIDAPLLRRRWDLLRTMATTCAFE
jgi:glycosyltransferase involved in cell wall biosynthesis